MLRDKFPSQGKKVIVAKTKLT